MAPFLVKLALAASLASPTWAATMLRKPPLHPDIENTVSLRKLKFDAPAVDRMHMSSSLPVYVATEGDHGNLSLVRRDYAFNFSAKDVSSLHYAEAHGLTKATMQCTPGMTIFDVGFYDGADASNYLSGGYCVVGIEADPTFVEMAMQSYAPFIASGQLRMANIAIAPEGEPEAWTKFYKSKCGGEWNSFEKAVGCRACQPPHQLDMTACEEVEIAAMDCSNVFGTFGVPHYMKLDIEGAETGCFQAMKRFPPNVLPPPYISVEITELSYIDHLSMLGYTFFKLVRQDGLTTTSSSTSGPWGENALDCRVGTAWRNYADIRTEFTTVLAKPLDTNDPCPGGIMPTRSSPKPAAAYMWYDIHAKRP